MNATKVAYRESRLFSDQLQAFSVWLKSGTGKKSQVLSADNKAYFLPNVDAETRLNQGPEQLRKFVYIIFVKYYINWWMS